MLSVTALGSIEETLSIGMKTLRRVAKSTTSPRTRGCWRTMLRLITTSRTRPIDSPSGPSTNIRASRAVYTLSTDPMGESLGSSGPGGSGNAVSITAVATCLLAGCLAVAWIGWNN